MHLHTFEVALSMEEERFYHSDGIMGLAYG